MTRNKVVTLHSLNNHTPQAAPYQWDYSSGAQERLELSASGCTIDHKTEDLGIVWDSVPDSHMPWPCNIPQGQGSLVRVQESTVNMAQGACDDMNITV